VRAPPCGQVLGRERPSGDWCWSWHPHGEEPVRLVSSGPGPRLSGRLPRLVVEGLLGATAADELAQERQASTAPRSVVVDVWLRAPFPAALAG